MNARTIKKDLQAAYPCRMELHAHTRPVSACSEILPQKMAEIYASLGFDAVVITNHFRHEENKDDYIERYVADYEMTKVAAEKYGLTVLLGAEITFTENPNDYLLYGVTKEMLSDIYDLLPYGVANFRREYPLENSAFLQAHPFRNYMERMDPSLFDGIEVFNMHPGHNSRIGLAASYAREQGFSMLTAGSDFHHLDQGHEGLGAVRCKCCPQTSFEVADILKSRDYLLEIGRQTLVLP